MGDEVVTAAPSVGAAPATSMGTGASQATGDLDPGQGDFLSAIQAGASAAEQPEAPSESEGLATDDWGTLFDEPPAETPPATAATPEPAPGQEPPPETPAAAPTAPVPETAEQKAEKVRAALKSTNLDPNLKGVLADAYYRDRFYAERGYTPDVVRELNESGVTPEGMVKRIHLHHTIEDAEEDAQLASTMREIRDDFAENPAAMVEKLRTTDTGLFNNFLGAVVAALPTQAPELYQRAASGIVWTALSQLEQDAQAGGDADGLASVEWAKSKLFGEGAKAPMAAQPQQEHPAQAELQRLRQEQQRLASQQRESFETQLRDEGGKALHAEITKRLEATGSTAFTKEALGKMASEVFWSVADAMKGNRTFMATMKRFVGGPGPLTRDRYQQAYRYAFEHAKTLIPIHQRQVMEEYRKLLPQPVSQPPAPPKPAAPPKARPDVGGVGGAPSAAPNPTAALIAERAKRGLSVLDVMQLAGRSGRR